MDFSFSDEQNELRELARKILGDLVTNERLKDIEAREPRVVRGGDDRGALLARAARLEVVETEISTLRSLEAESEQLGESLARLETSQADNLAVLESARDARRTALVELEADIENSGGAIRRLRDEAQRLGELVAELNNSRIAFPPDAAGGFSSVAGELEWPVSGSIVIDFGQQRAGGQLRWNGVVP